VIHQPCPLFFRERRIVTAHKPQKVTHIPFPVSSFPESPSFLSRGHTRQLFFFPPLGSVPCPFQARVEIVQHARAVLHFRSFSCLHGIGVKSGDEAVQGLSALLGTGEGWRSVVQGKREGRWRDKRKGGGREGRKRMDKGLQRGALTHTNTEGEKCCG
jgi:hypothetical protein